MSDVLFITIGYVLAFGMAIFLISFFQRGFFLPFLKVKASRGKKVLVRVRSSLEDYYTTGDVSEGVLTFIDQDKDSRKLSIDKMVFYRSLNLQCVDVDDESNSVVTRNFSIANGFDAKKFSNLLTRALTKPKDLDKEQKIILILLFIIAAAIAFTLFMVFNLTNSIDQLSISASSSVGEL